MSQERDVLFGLMALVHRQVDPPRLMTAAQASREGSFGDEMVRSGVLTPADRKALEDMVDAHVSQHGGDTGKAITALGAGKVLLLDLRTALGVPEETESIFASLAASSSQTRAEGLETIKPGEGGSGGTVPAVGEHPGRYKELRHFASGGMGSILLVHDNHIGRDVALKQLLPDAVGSGTRTRVPTIDMLTVPVIARFLQEARVTGQLEHPSIVPVYELGYRDDGSLYYTMKLVRGKSMQQALKEAPTLKDRLPLLNHFLDLCYAITYAHTRGVVHRDLKPLNVMIGEFGETIVIDWGIAKVKGSRDIHAKDLEQQVNILRVGDTEATAKTMFGQTIGSPYFMPPEQAAGDTNAIDERSDVYALGAVLYNILTGKPPYAGNTVREFMERVKSFPPKPVKELEPDAPAELAAVCTRALERDPKKRYQSTKALTEEIQRFLSGGLVSAYEYRFSELFKRFVKKHRRVLTTAAAGATAAIAIAVFSYFQVMEQRDIAVANEKIAQEERAKAVEAQKLEEQAKLAAIAAEEEAVLARDQARRELYFAKIALTPRAIGEQQMAQARNLLGECPEEFRAWEWGHLLQEANQDKMTLRDGGRYAAFSPDGTRVVTGSGNGTVRLYDRRTGNELATLADKAGSGYALAFSADGGRVACSGDQAVQVWDTLSGAVVAEYAENEGANPTHQVALSADGARVAAVGNDQQVRVWNVGEAAPMLAVPTGKSRANLALSPGGDLLLLLNEARNMETLVLERTFEVFAIVEGKSLGRGVVPDPLSVHCAAFAPSGGLLAMGTDEGLQIWDVQGWKKLHELPGRFRHPGTIQFTPDGQWIASGTNDGDLAIWSVADGKGVSLPKAHQSAIRAMALKSDSTLLATVSQDRTVKLWSVPPLRLLRVLRGHNYSVFAAAFSPDGTELATGSYDGSTKIWDIADELAYAQVTQLAYSASSGRVAGVADGQAVIWDVQTGHRVTSFGNLPGRIEASAFDGTGAFLATVNNDGGTATARIWEVDSGAERAAFEVKAGTRMLHLQDGGGRLFVQGTSTLSIFDAAAPGDPKVYEGVRDLALARGAHYALSQSESGTDKTRRIGVFGYGDAAAKGTFEVATELGSSMAFSPDGAFLYVGTQVRENDTARGVVHVWDVANQAELRVLEGHTAQISCIAFSREGGLVATGGRDNTVRIWNGADGAMITTCTGHADNVLDVVFSPDATRVVTASQDGTFKIWSAQDGREILTLQSAALASEGQVVAPARAKFSPDGRSLLTLTAPEPLAPRVLRAFPHEGSAYPGAPDIPLMDRVEAYKRTN